METENGTKDALSWQFTFQVVAGLVIHRVELKMNIFLVFIKKKKVNRKKSLSERIVIDVK